MSRVAWELVVAGQGEKYTGFVSNENLWSAQGGKFVVQECAVGDGSVYMDGCRAWRVPWLKIQLGGSLTQRPRERTRRGQQIGAFRVVHGGN